LLLFLSDKKSEHGYVKEIHPCSPAQIGMTTVIIIIIIIIITYPIFDRGGLYDCEKLRIPHCLYNRLTDGDEGVSLTHQPHSTPKKLFFSICDTDFC
jgi:hypothetical protein